MRLNILHAYKTYYPDNGGIPAIIQSITEGIACHHHQVLCTHKQPIGKVENIHQVIVYRLASFGEILSLPVTPHYPLALWHKARQCQILDYHFPMPWVDLAIASYLPKSIRLVIHWHSEIIRQKKLARWLTPMIQRCLARADKIIVADNAYLEHSTFLTPYRHKCAVIPYGIDTDHWQKTTITEQETIEQLRTKKPFILAVGRLVSYKGFSTLIAAMQFVDADLIIVGQGPLANELQQLAANCQLSERIHFYGKMEPAQLKCLYHAANLFVLPSVSENEAFGMVQLEAMACKKPIINTALNSAVPKVARHQQEALTVPPAAIEPLANAINQLLAQPELASTLAANGLQRVKNHYSLKHFLTATSNLYHSLS